MGIIQYFPVNEFYTIIDPGQYRQGQFCWIVTPVIKPIPQILDVERSDPEEHDDVKFTLRNANLPGDFRAADRTLPIKRLNLRAHEELLIQRAKKRPGIIISDRLDNFSEITAILRAQGKKHLQEDSLFVIPCYGIETLDNPFGFPSEMVIRIRCLLYRQFFYLPASSHTGESIARFDRVQVVVGKDRSAIEPLGLCLSEDVFTLFLSLFFYCISGVEDSDLSAIRSLTREAYPQP
jgi:hypothetical protein